MRLTLQHPRRSHVTPIECEHPENSRTVVGALGLFLGHTLSRSLQEKAALRSLKGNIMEPIATIGAGCLLIENDTVLLVQPNYGRAKGSWILPGGFVQSGETPTQAALRELQEETGQEGTIIKPHCVRFRTNPTDVYWVYLVKRSLVHDLRIQTEELMDVRFWSLPEAIGSQMVRPMTRYVIQTATAPTPELIPMDPAILPTDTVNFFR